MNRNTINFIGWLAGAIATIFIGIGTVLNGGVKGLEMWCWWQDRKKKKADKEDEEEED